MGNCCGCDGCGPSNTEFDFLLGLTTDEATEELKDQGIFINIIWEDGEHFFTSADVRDDRLSVAVQDGKIIRVFGLG